MMHNQLVREYPYNKSPYTHEEMLKIFQVKAKAIIKFLEEEKPDFIFISVIGSIGAMLLYYICKSKGIKTIMVQTAMIKNTFILSEDFRNFSWVNEIFQKNEKLLSDQWTEASKKFLNDFRNAPHPHWEYGDPRRQPITRLQQFEFLKPKKLFNILQWLGNYFLEHYKQKNRFDYDYIGPWNYLKDSFKRKLRNIIRTNNLYDTFDPSENFAYFPLHYEPEIAVSLLAPFTTDQIDVIKHIAISLPVGYRLYVKEHPAMVVYRPRSYYLELKNIPNLKLINPQISNFKIIPFTKLITTISGTTGWEGCLLKKPIITFGHIFYNSLSFVKNCRSMEQLPYLVKEQLENFKYNEEELLHFIGIIIQDSANVNLLYLWEKESDMQKKKQGLEPLADLLAKKLHLIPQNQ
ncbi:hypothetical protein HZA42_01375 [Candidatus Peregrinibacteria bacterium]|nr:hypothetical protein [Candidatus Peregrinibacteria bacterium]